MNVPLNSQFARDDLKQRDDVSSLGASSRLVNRTHRVVRQRAQLLKERREYVRSLMLPLAICSALLILTVAAVWTGMYDYQNAADALQDVSSTIAAATDDEFMVMLFWFVPVTLAVTGTVWLARSRSNAANGISR